jgi:nucleoside-triphosphatase THEP1
MRKKIIIISGPVGSGKSTLVHSFLKAAADAGIRAGGVAVRLEAGERYGLKPVYAVTDILSGEQRVLLTETQLGRDCGGGQRLGRFCLDREVMAWAESCVRKAAEVCDAVVIDELGRLELDGGGYLKAAQELAATYAGSLLLVVRSSLVDAMLQLIGVKHDEVKLFTAEGNCHENTRELIGEAAENE